MKTNQMSDPKFILVTGANGFVGSSVVKSMVNMGYSIKAVMRKASHNHSEAVEIITADLSHPIDWAHDLKGISTVIHLAARVHQMNESPQDSLDEFRNINTRATLELAEQSAKAGVRRFIYLSTMAVNGSHTLPGEFFTEDSQPNPRSSYALSKYASEQGLKKISEQYPMEVVIIRPPMVYGANAPGNFSKLVSLIKSRVPLPFALAKAPRSFIYIGNLVNFIEVCINHPGAANEIFLVSDADDISLAFMIDQISRSLHLRVNLFPLPIALLEGLLTLLGRSGLANQLLKPMRIDISKAQGLLEWVPQYSSIDGVKFSIGHGDQ